MKVILQKDVPNLGDAGEIKDVASGFARNYLIPRKLVIPALEGNTRALEHQKKLMEIKSARRAKEMEGVAEKLKGLGSVQVSVRVGVGNKMFGSVTPMQIAQVLAENDFAIDRRKIELGEKIKAPGNYNFKVKLAEKISVPLTLEVIPIHEEEEYVSPVTEDHSADDEQAEASTEETELTESAES